MEQLKLFDAENVKSKKPNGGILREEFGECPFSVFDVSNGNWQKNKKKWLALGIKGEKGRNAYSFTGGFSPEYIERYSYMTKSNSLSAVSIFDPYLTQILYRWFCPENGKILDPFAGGSVRGIVANYLGYKYTGIDIREQQIQQDLQQAEKILQGKEKPVYICGDSNTVLDDLQGDFDFVFSCPPYGDLEVYSDLPGDISNMEYNDFLKAYSSIINKSCDRLKKGGFACFVVSEFRDKSGAYVGFVADTVKLFQNAGMKYWNQIIYKQPVVTASLRARRPFVKSKKVCRIHQVILVFKKG